MGAVQKATFQEAMKFLIPALWELSKLGVPYDVNEAKRKIIIKVPRFIPMPTEKWIIDNKK